MFLNFFSLCSLSSFLLRLILSTLDGKSEQVALIDLVPHVFITKRSLSLQKVDSVLARPCVH